MILSAIFHFFKAVMSVVIKAVAWLLVSLSLWVPLLYSLVFLIACGATGASLTALKTWYFVGLALSFVVSFAISNFLFERKLRAKRKAKKANGNIEKVKAAEASSSITMPVSAPMPELSPLAEEQPFDQVFTEQPDTHNIVEQAKENSFMPQNKEAKAMGETASKYGFMGFNDMGTGGGGWKNPVSGQYNPQSVHFQPYNQLNQPSYNPQSVHFQPYNQLNQPNYDPQSVHFQAYNQLNQPNYDPQSVHFQAYNQVNQPQQGPQPFDKQLSQFQSYGQFNHGGQPFDKNYKFQPYNNYNQQNQQTGFSFDKQLGQFQSYNNYNQQNQQAGFSFDKQLGQFQPYNQYNKHGGMDFDKQLGQFQPYNNYKQRTNQPGPALEKQLAQFQPYNNYKQQPNQPGPAFEKQLGQFQQYNNYNQPQGPFQQPNFQPYGNVNPQHNPRDNKYREVEFAPFDMHRAENGTLIGERDGFAPGEGKSEYAGQSQNVFKTALEGFGESGFSSRGRGFAQSEGDFENGQNTEQPQGFEGTSRRFDRGQLAEEKKGEFVAEYNQTESTAQNNYGDNFNETENYAPAESFSPSIFGGLGQPSGNAYDFNRTSAVHEQPSIFATRHDPTVFIYEYSNRIDYYKRTRSGMIFMHSRPKTAD